MNDAGDVVGARSGVRVSAVAIWATSQANFLTPWTPAGSHTQTDDYSSGLTTINEGLSGARIVTGLQQTGHLAGNISTTVSDYFISQVPLALSVLSTVTRVCNTSTEQCTTTGGDAYSFRDINNLGGGVGMKHIYNPPPGQDMALYYNLASTPSGDSAFEPYGLNDTGLVAGLSNDSVFRLWEPSTTTFRNFTLPNPVTRQSIRITNCCNDGGAVRVTDAPATDPKATTYILVGDNLITRAWKNANGDPSLIPIYTVFAASQLIPPNSPYFDVALKNIANNGLIAATAHSQLDQLVHTLLLIPPNIATSYLKLNDIKLGGDENGDCGMAQYSAHALRASLNIQDTPFRYSPPIGPAIAFTVTYNQKEDQQPTSFSYSNLGPNWTFNWMAYVTDDPSLPATSTSVYLPGGGSESYTLAGNSFPADPQSHAILVRTGLNSYERRSPDGSIQVFSASDNAVSFPRKLFMTQWIDPTGNSVTLEYDPMMRIIHIKDALNQTTTLQYNEPDQFKISKVVEPFPLARYAAFIYTNGQLTTITDEIGIQSIFHYTPGTNFIDQLATPYGTAHFARGLSPNSWIEMVDFAGGLERVEYRDHAPGINANDPPGSVPTGSTNGGLDVANTFFWSKKATALYPPVGGVYDYTKARITHWLYNRDETTSGIPASDKAPLENRVWYSYTDQADRSHVGTSAQPTRVARVLGDNTTQLWQYEYNSLDKMTESIDPSGRVMNYDYDPNGIDLSTVRHGSEVIRAVGYNSKHEPIVDTSAAGQQTLFGYNSRGQLTTVENARHESTSYSYGNTVPDGYLESITSPMFNNLTAVTTFSYDSSRRIHTVTNVADQYTVTMDYDYLDRPTQITFPDGTNQKFEYTDNVRGMTLDLTGSKDRLDRWTRRHYNANRQMDSITDPLQHTTLYGWCTCGALESITDPMGQITLFNRDLQSRVYQKVFDDNTAINYLFEGQSTPNTVGVTSRMASSTDALNRRTNYFYYVDDNINEVSYTDPSGNTLFPPTPLVYYSYDPTYNRIMSIATEGIGSIDYTYYPFTPGSGLNAGRLHTVHDSVANDTITFTYDELGRRHEQFIDGVSEMVTYDSLGRLWTTNNALGSFTRTYDGVTPRLLTLFYPNGQSANYSYYGNQKDRRLQTQHNLSNGSTILSTFEFDYDAEGQISPLSKTLDSTTSKLWFDYDDARQLKNARNAANPNLATLEMAYGYDRASNRTSDGTFNPTGVPSNGIFHQYTPNDVNEITNYSTQSGGTMLPPVTLLHDLAGNLVDDGLGKTFEWDAANRLTTVNNTITGQRSEFTYDGLGRRVKIKEYGPGVTATIRPKATNYSPFTTAQFAIPSGGYTLTFFGLKGDSGDAVLIDSVRLSGTLIENGDFENPDVSRSPGGYELDPSDATWNFTGPAGLAAKDSDVTHGNPGGPDGSQVAFVEKGGIISQSTNIQAGKYTLSFQAAQRAANAGYLAVQVTLRSSTTGVTVKTFVWCGDQISEERDGTTAAVTKRFFADGEQRVDTGVGNLYYSRDYLGSIRELTDSGGGVVAQYDYDPYGNRVVLKGKMDTDFGYTGHYFHAPSGLTLTLYRAYNPQLGRWISRDPIGENGGLNLYGYVLNSPIRSIDPLGLEGPDYLFEDEYHSTLGTQHGRDVVEQSPVIVNKVIRDAAIDMSMAVAPELGIWERFLNLFRWGKKCEKAVEYGSTPAGRTWSSHYANDTAAIREIPGSVIDNTIDTVKGIPAERGKTVFFDPINNITVVTGDGGVIVSARKGKPRPGQF